jgi:hypothetical protein
VEAYGVGNSWELYVSSAELSIARSAASSLSEDIISCFIAEEDEPSAFTLGMPFRIPSTSDAHTTEFIAVLERSVDRSKFY